MNGVVIMMERSKFAIHGSSKEFLFLYDSPSARGPPLYHGI